MDLSATSVSRRTLFGVVAATVAATAPSVVSTVPNTTPGRLSVSGAFESFVQEMHGTLVSDPRETTYAVYASSDGSMLYDGSNPSIVAAGTSLRGAWRIVISEKEDNLDIVVTGERNLPRSAQSALREIAQSLTEFSPARRLIAA